MDTIEISLAINDNLEMIFINLLEQKINNLKSPNGFTFCDVLNYSTKGNLIIKISYPRYFCGNNAFLITKRSQCFEVQKHFAKHIMEDGYFKEVIGELKILRVDIPFTYYMNKGKTFSSYENIYRIFAFVYNNLKEDAIPKAFIDMILNNMETIIYSDNGKSDKSSNNRLMIYNQYANLKSKLKKEVFEEILVKYDDLPYRIRMEVSKRIRLRIDFNSQTFSTYDILGHYFEEYKKYILKYVLNKEKIEELYNNWAEYLARLLKEERTLTTFNYETFLLKNLSLIYDYEILKRALKSGIDNESTRENATTKIRKILKNIERERNIIILDTYNVITEMRNTISNYRLLD